MATTERRGTSVRVLMFPWLAYGHISPFLNLAKNLADRGFLISLCSTPINLESIKRKITHKYSLSVQLVELHLPDLPGLPPHYHTTNGLPRHHNITLQKALNLSKPNFTKIMETLKPDLLIYDVFQEWAQGVANKQSIPAVKLVNTCAGVFSYFNNMRNNPGVDFPFPALYSKQIELLKLAKFTQEMGGKDRDLEGLNPFAQGTIQIMLMSTSTTFDAKYIDYMTQLTKWKVVPVGPPVQDPVIADDGHDVELLDWLGGKQENSTVFISFGSESFLSKEDMEEIAFGLELSKNVNFLWVVRFPKGEEVELKEALPNGFLERIGERGRVLDNKWAPQSTILNHPSTGGFISHCGWNSVMESLHFGVPIVAMPIDFDQPITARFMVELGVAVEILRDDNHGKIHREEIAQLLEDVINGETGKSLRTKATDLSNNLKSIRDQEMDSAAQVLIKLCQNKNSNSRN